MISDLDMELAALNEAIRSLDHERYVSQDQIGGLIGLTRQGLADKSRENRIAVMDYMIGETMETIQGVPFQSFKNISGATATFMIEKLREPESKPWRLNNYGRDLIAAVESRVKAYLAA